MQSKKQNKFVCYSSFTKTEVGVVKYVHDTINSEKWQNIEANIKIVTNQFLGDRRGS